MFICMQRMQIVREYRKIFYYLLQGGLKKIMKYVILPPPLPPNA